MNSPRLSDQLGHWPSLNDWLSEQRLKTYLPSKAVFLRVFLQYSTLVNNLQDIGYDFRKKTAFLKHYCDGNQFYAQPVLNLMM